MFRVFIQVFFSRRSMGAVDLAEVDDDEAEERREESAMGKRMPKPTRQYRA